jgi:O-antigen/teichoic acid export membrane protein
MLDHALITGSNFVIGVLLARWLSPEQYGAYAVAFAALLLLIMLYTALILEPQAVFGGSAYRGVLRGYLKALLQLHHATALVVLVVFGVWAEVAFKLKQPGGLPGALGGVALAAPCICLFWLARRTFYLEFSPAFAVAGSLLYCAALFSGLYVVNRLHFLSPMSALLLMGLAALGASVFLLIYLKVRLPVSAGAPNLRETWRRHWSYGQWALATALVMWIPFNIFYPLLSSFSGMAQAGELKALMNFGAPVLQAYASLSSLLLPYAARVHDREGYAGTNVLAWRLSLLCASGAVVYWVPLLVFKGPAFRLLYSGRYTEVAYLLPVVALGSVAWSGYLGFANALRATASPASVFVAVSVSSAVALTVGVPAAWVLGVRGAVWCSTLSELLVFVMTLVLLRRKVRSASDAVPMLQELPLKQLGD